MLARLWPWIALAFPLAAIAFNPAQPSNDTSSLSTLTPASLVLNWNAAGQLVYENGLARVVQARSDSPVGGYRSVLQRYSESNYTNPRTAGPPWIALISCDPDDDFKRPETASWSSPEQATQSGAITTILYSTTAETCLCNSTSFVTSSPYRSDVYVTTSKAVAVDMLERFNEISYPILWYRGDTLRIDNDRIQKQVYSIGGSAAPPVLPSNSTSTSFVQDYVIGTILLPFPNPPTLVLATWRNRSSGQGGISPTNKIVVYAVAACVAGILATVMLLSAIKSFRRQPEVVTAIPTTPRPPAPRGLGKVLFDAIPVMTFGSFLSTKSENQAKSAEEGKSSVELQDSPKPKISTEHVEGGVAKEEEGDGVIPVLAYDDHTCPICLIEFDQEDDIRVLPCDARHTFHDACITPWLLDVSSLCPLCRLDLSKPAQPVGASTAAPEVAAGVGAAAAAEGQRTLARTFRGYISERRGNLRRQRG